MSMQQELKNDSRTTCFLWVCIASGAILLVDMHLDANAMLEEARLYPEILGRPTLDLVNDMVWILAKCVAGLNLVVYAIVFLSRPPRGLQNPLDHLDEHGEPVWRL